MTVYATINSWSIYIYIYMFIYVYNMNVFVNASPANRAVRFII